MHRKLTEIIKILFEEILLKDAGEDCWKPLISSSIEDGQIDYSIVDLDRDNIAVYTTQNWVLWIP